MKHQLKIPNYVTLICAAAIALLTLRPVFAEEISDIQKFQTHQTELIEGDTNQCGSASGVYRFNSMEKSTQLRFTYLEKSDLAWVLYYLKSTSPLQILAAQPLPDISRRHNGLLIQTTEGWFLIEGTAFTDILIPLTETDDDPYQVIRTKGYSGTHLTELAAAFVQFRNTGSAPTGYRVTKIEFSLDMLNGRTNSHAMLDYLANASIADYIDRHHKVFANFDKFITSKNVRVPPEMYQLSNDPSFVYARTNNQFSKVMDMIYQKSLTVMNNDRFSALFVSLLMTDLRTRGPCGAVFGKRGLNYAPPSIFDGETFSYVNPSRRDAAPHFFAYALIASLNGGKIGGPLVSKIGKEQQYRFPQIANLFRHLHVYADDASQDAGVEFDVGVANKLTGSTFKLERSHIDIRRDMFYNDLGLAFGQVKLISVLPSNVLNDQIFFQRKRALGFGLHNEGPWEAYNPDNSVPRVTAFPVALRTNDLPPWPQRMIWAISSDRQYLYEHFQMADFTASSREHMDDLVSEYVWLSGFDSAALERECAVRKSKLPAVQTVRQLERIFYENPNAEAYEPCQNRPILETFKRVGKDQTQNERLRPTDDEMVVLRTYCERAKSDFKRVNACRLHNDELVRRFNELRVKANSKH